MHASHLGAAIVSTNVTPAQAVFIEILITFALTIAFFMNAQDKGKVAAGNIAPIPIGFAVIVGILAAGRLTGAAMNPARALGPAIAGAYYQDHWVFWVPSLHALSPLAPRPSFPCPRVTVTGRAAPSPFWASLDLGRCA